MCFGIRQSYSADYLITYQLKGNTKMRAAKLERSPQAAMTKPRCLFFTAPAGSRNYGEYSHLPIGVEITSSIASSPFTIKNSVFLRIGHPFLNKYVIVKREILK